MEVRRSVHPWSALTWPELTQGQWETLSPKVKVKCNGGKTPDVPLWPPHTCTQRHAQVHTPIPTSIVQPTQQKVWSWEDFIAGHAEGSRVWLGKGWEGRWGPNSVEGVRREGKDKLAEFCVGSYGAVSDKACSDLRCWDWVEDGRTMRERLTAGFPGLSEDEDCSC